MLTFSLINNRTVQNGNEDYWTRLGAILKENQDLGMSNKEYEALMSLGEDQFLRPVCAAIDMNAFFDAYALWRKR